MYWFHKIMTKTLLQIMRHDKGYCLHYDLILERLYCGAQIDVLQIII